MEFLHNLLKRKGEMLLNLNFSLAEINKFNLKKNFKIEKEF